ncbi:hypothetical protein JR316_0011626 [Psilocybe cubensis]|uniref:Uncharacterized protein n=2 Tax=Psilocybe cubensis TaxID=181762 RepID=A0ACB8GKI9_PSICU|nr:hypothetical protein JR316_0011626 [Psilocybe cubensis]KAH9476056.1 hypothetical protein JR316_0011626 [Psilocybe cubensis]
MGKNSKKRKNGPEKTLPQTVKKLKQNELDVCKAETAAVNLVQTGGMIGGLIYEDELETTTDTLLMLANNPSLIGLKALKPFKTAVHDYWRVANEATQTGNSLTSRISKALIDQRHIDALVLLAEMAIREQVPKLGALQRWVRECDAVLSPKMSKQEENRVWQVLDAILRTTQPEMIAQSSTSDGGKIEPGSRLRWYTPFTIESDPPARTVDIDSDAIASAATKVLVPLQITPGPDRRPPNKHPAIIYFSPDNTFPLLPSSERSRQPTRHELPGVPGAFIINDALEIQECEALVKAAESVGLIPDEPIAGSATQLSSVLAHNLIWLADTSFITTLYQRLVHLLPQTVHGGAVKGINSRFRLYRYRPGALYRPHIDGAWPSSALNSTTNPPTYVYDSDPTVYSRLTFLIYLNDDFDGGCTTFFLPSSTQGILEARPVKPRTGTVCVFPHGAAKGSLLHEGSGVISGAKYVIRTEVLYEVDASERIDATKD